MVDRIRVLHVDDDEEFGELTAEFLERESDRFEVLTESGAADALARLAEEDGIDCVVSDYDMPRMDGLAFLEAVREEYPSLPFILFTGKGSEEVASDAIAAGATDYLQKRGKAGNFELLANRIRNAVRQRERERQLERQKERLDTVVSNVPVVLYALDPDGTFTFSEGKGLEKLDLEPGEVVGESVFDVYADHEGIVEDHERALAGESVSSTREVDGVTFDTNVQPLFDDGGDVEAVIGVAVDVTERTERERQLQRERDRVTALFENMAEPIVYYEFEDGDPLVEEVNPAFEETFGVTEAEARGRVLDDIVVPDAYTEEGLAINERVRAGEIVDTEVRRRTADGVRTFNLLSVPLSPGESGERGFAVYTDVTERKERERDLEQYRTLVETVGDPMYILDSEGHVEFANRAMADYVDIPRAEVTGIHASEVLAEGDFERGTDLLVELLSDPDREWGLYEITVVTETGERKQAECNVAPLVDADGEYAGSVGVVRDISERKRRQNAFEALHEVATTIQTERTVEAVCERTVSAAADILDFTLCSVIIREGEWLVPYATSEDAPTDGSRRMRIDQGLAGKTYQTGRSEIIEEVTPDDETDPADDSYRSGISVPIGDHGVFQAVSTEPDAFDSEDVEFAELLVSHTASAIERIEREADLERQNERLDEFASIVSHDLRNPLSVAGGRLELAREECDSEHLDAIARSHDRMERLIDDLLTLAREGEAVSEFEAVDLAATVGRCWDNVETAEATLEVVTDADVRADAGRLQQLLENLIRNAVEHGGEDVTVTVGTLPDGTGFYVEDDGPGIPESDREEVFEFGHSTTEDGTGFGLAIVARIAGAHGWEVAVTDGTEGGARFELTGVDFES